MEKNKTLQHTVETKINNSEIERIIKKFLTKYELLSILDSNGYEEGLFRGISITKDFKGRILPEEESGVKINPAHIKSSVLGITKKKLIEKLYKKIDEKVADEKIAEQYKKGIKEYFTDTATKNKEIGNANPKLRKFLTDNYKKYLEKQKEDPKSIERFNILMQITKILHKRFGDSIFIEKENGNNEIKLSPLCEDYFQRIFYNANEVWKEWENGIGEVFHDNDFPWIKRNKKVTIEKYITAIQYLMTRDKENYYGENGIEGDKKRIKKTTQYADILRALTNKQLGIHNDVIDNKENLKFEWDEVTQKFHKETRNILSNKINAYNLNKEEKDALKISDRKKGLPSSVEKIIEGNSKIVDVMGFRISAETINENAIEEVIKTILIPGVKEIIGNTKNPTTCQEYGIKKGESLELESIQIDNKNILDKEQENRLIKQLNEQKIPAKKREKKQTSYISTEEWLTAMKKYFAKDMNDKELAHTYETFFNQFSGGKKRGVNGGYKDFKIQMVFEHKDKNNKSLGKKTIEIQFDIVDNGVGIANFNIRNCERRVNTQSNLTFDISLKKVRELTEENLKDMQLWIEDKPDKFKIIEFEHIDENGKKYTEKIDISTFTCRDGKNKEDLDKAIINVVNYFIKKGTFLLYRKINNSTNILPLKNGLLTTECLQPQYRENIHICSSQEVARQQYSYLGTKGEHQIGIYTPNNGGNIMWADIKEVIERMNLGKKKNPEFAVKI